MKALQIEKSLLRFGAASLIARTKGSGKGASIGPLRYVDIPMPKEINDNWIEIKPILSGICGSDLSMLDGKSSRELESFVSFPFIPGHEVVGIRADTKKRIVIEPLLGCISRGLSPCGSCLSGHHDRCANLAFGDVDAGLQIGFCKDTSGGWAESFFAHITQIHEIPDSMDDSDALLVEPAACAIHAVLQDLPEPGSTVVILGAGTLGLLTLAAVAEFGKPKHIVVAAKYNHQKQLARELGATHVVDSDKVQAMVRSLTKSRLVGDTLSNGADTTYDCVGSSATIESSIMITKPRGTLVLVGMPTKGKIDLTFLWQRQIQMHGAYTYGTEQVSTGDEVPGAANGDASHSTSETFKLAIDMSHKVGLGRLHSATYSLEHYEDALLHAGQAGSRGAIKIAFAPNKNKKILREETETL
ncbi:MAG: zinc-binding dehydrogenase [Acidimicrobiales bacterium]|nr:zinc-binding dehydrogenase [Acidimicrobiales bacterium]